MRERMMGFSCFKTIGWCNGPALSLTLSSLVSAQGKMASCHPS